jgi:hypothetical protein
VITLRVTGEARKKYRRVVAPVELVAITDRQAKAVLGAKKMTMGGGLHRLPVPADVAELRPAGGQEAVLREAAGAALPALRAADPGLHDARRRARGR